MKFNGKLKHAFSHENCKCFEFLDECWVEQINGSELNGKNVYGDTRMARYPFYWAITTKDRFIPFGFDPTLTVIDPIGIYRMVSSREYMFDSTIYFDFQLRPLYHIYSHKSGFELDPVTEEKIRDAYPKRPKIENRSQYMSWKYKF